MDSHGVAMQGLYAAPDAGQWIPEVFASLGIQILGLPGSWIAQESAYLSVVPAPATDQSVQDQSVLIRKASLCSKGQLT